MLAISDSAPPAAPGLPLKTSPWRMSVPSTSSCAVAVEVDEAHVRHRRRAGHSGIAIARRVNESGDSAGSGQASGGGQTLGRAAHVERQHLLHVGRQLHAAIDDAGRSDGRQSRSSRMNIMRTNSSRQPSRGRMSGGGIRVAGTADRARLALGVCRLMAADWCGCGVRDPQACRDDQRHRRAQQPGAAIRPRARSCDAAAACRCPSGDASRCESPVARVARQPQPSG